MDGVAAASWGLGILLARIARRAVRLWALLYERRYAELVRLAFAVTSDSGLAEELAQEAFVRVWHSWRNIRDQQSAPTYLRATVVSLVGAAGPGRHCCPAAKNTTPPCWALTGCGSCLGVTEPTCEQSSLSGLRGCASSASRRPPSRVSGLLADRRAGPAVPGMPRYRRPRPTARPRTGRPGSGAVPPPPDHPLGARPAPAMTARLRAGASRRRPAQGGPMVPAKTGRSTLGRRWSRAEKRRTREFGRLREARSRR